MASDGNALWVLTESGGLIRIDPASNAADPALELGELGPGLFTGISADSSGVWATRLRPGLVYRVDPTNRVIVATIEVDDAKGVLAADGAVWVARAGGAPSRLSGSGGIPAAKGTVARIDPATNEVVATITVGQATSTPFKLVTGFGSIWVGVLPGNSVVRIDPTTNAVQAAIPALATTACILAAAVDAIWNSSCDRSSSLGRIDPATNAAVGTVELRGYGYASTLIIDALWVSVEPRSGQGQGSIVRIDATTNEVDRVLSPDMDFSGYGERMIVAGGSVWVLDYTNNQVLRLPLSAFGS
jgi:streptogramin lyase